MDTGRTQATRATRLLMLLLVVLASTISPLPSRAGAAATFDTATPFGPHGQVSGTWDTQPTVKAVPARVFRIVVDGTPTFAFCIEVGTPVDVFLSYDEIAWSEANVPNLGKITAILRQYPPSDAMPLLEVMAVQAAIWHFSDAFTLSGAPGSAVNFDDLVRKYNEVIAFANANPVPTEPPPSIELEPPTATGIVGDALPFLLSTTAVGPVRLTITSGSGRLVDCTTGGPAVNPVTGPLADHPVCVLSDDVGPTTVTATATATARAGRVFFHTGFQKLVLGADAVAEVDDSATATFEQPQVGLTVDKGGPELSKVGDAATWTVTVRLAAGPGAPTLVLQAATDTVASETLLLDRATVGGCGRMEPGEDCTFTYTAIIPEDAPDPFVNELTLTYVEVDGPAEHTVGDSHTTNLFQPALDVAKDGPDEAFVGDDVTWTITLEDTSSDDAPPLELVGVVDDVLGDLLPLATVADCPSLLPTTGTCTFDVDHVLTTDDPFPLVNEVTATTSPVGFPNQLTSRATHSLAVHDAVLEVAKVPNGSTIVGEVAVWDITITNRSRPGSPPIVVDTLVDEGVGWTGLGELTPIPTACLSLAPGASCAFTVRHTVLESDPDPLVNRIHVTAHPTGRDDIVVRVSDEATRSVATSSYTVDKEGPAHALPGDEVTYRFTITSTTTPGGPDLLVTEAVDDRLGTLTLPPACNVLAPGESCSFEVPWTVPPGQEPGPLTNEVEVVAGPPGVPPRPPVSATHTTAVLDPDLVLAMTGDALSKVTDATTLRFSVRHPATTGPDLQLTSFDGGRLGDLTVAARTAGCGVLVAGAPACTFDVQWVVPTSAPDPTTLTATGTWTYAGTTLRATATRSHILQLFQPAWGLAVTGPTTADAGDTVSYQVTVSNTSSEDSPDLVLSQLTDDVLGNLLTAATRAGCERTRPSETCRFTVAHTVASTASGPLSNTLTGTASPVGFPNRLPATARHSLTVTPAPIGPVVLPATEFNPDLTVTKTSAGLSKVGDPVTWTLTVENTSPVGSGALALQSAVDAGQGWAGLGDLTTAATAAGCASLTAGQSCSFDVERVVAPADPDPLVNTFTATYRAPGSTTDVVASDSDSVELFQPGIVITKSGPDQVVFGEVVTWSFRLFNTSSADTPDLLVTSVVDVGEGWPGLGDITQVAVAAGCDQLGFGRSCDFTVSATATTDLPVELANEVTVTARPDGFPNLLVASDDHTLALVDVLGEVEERPDPDGGPDDVGQPGLAADEIPATGTGALRLLLTSLSLTAQGAALVGLSFLTGVLPSGPRRRRD